MEARVTAEADGGIGYNGAPVVAISEGGEVVKIRLEDIDDLIVALAHARAELS